MIRQVIDKENCTDEKARYSECFEYLDSYMHCFGHRKHYDPWILQYRNKDDIHRCVRDLFEKSKHFKGFFEEFSREYDLKILAKYIRERDFERLLHEIGKYAREYFLGGYLNKSYITEEKFKMLMRYDDPWDSMKALYYESKRPDLLREIGKKSPIALKDDIKRIVIEILNEEIIDSYALLSNLSDTLRDVNSLLEINSRDGFGIKVNIDGVKISLDNSENVRVFNQSRT